ncbi:MAG: nuclear transport factor 2 family protein [Candidatus Limnocylindrales bacterium]
MPWLPEFDGLIPCDRARLAEAFPGGVNVDDPLWGRIAGSAAVRDFIVASGAWLVERAARARLVAITDGAARRVAEYDVDVTMDGRTFVLPVAVMIEARAEGRHLDVRIYHSRWPLTGAHHLRPPLLAEDATQDPSDVVGEYHAALGAGDVARIVATFEPDGCFREPSGPQYRRCGTPALTELFTRFFGAGGGIVLEHCTVTEDGVRSALEFNAVRWGRVALPRQAGIAIYERGANGRIADARVYDDVAGPVE